MAIDCESYYITYMRDSRTTLFSYKQWHQTDDTSPDLNCSLWTTELLSIFSFCLKVKQAFFIWYTADIISVLWSPSCRVSVAGFKSCSNIYSDYYYIRLLLLKLLRNKIERDYIKLFQSGKIFYLMKNFF